MKLNLKEKNSYLRVLNVVVPWEELKDEYYKELGINHFVLVFIDVTKGEFIRNYFIKINFIIRRKIYIIIIINKN